MGFSVCKYSVLRLTCSLGIQIRCDRRGCNSMIMNTCNFMQHKTSRPPPDALGINVERPKYPQYAVYSKRMESFETWPEYLPVGKDELVEAGLTYTGVGDSCRCYHCGGGLRNWEPGDKPMREHAKWYPKCPHVLLVKGQAYIDKVRNGELVEEDGASQNVADNALAEIDYLEMPSCLSCIEMGFSKKMVKEAVKIFISKNKHSNFKGADICQILFDLEENPDFEIQETVETDGDAVGNALPENLNILKEENERLKETTLCKVCVDKRADVLFLPCGHMICCPQCAPAMVKCPICRKTINGQMKAFFAVSSK